MTCHHTIDGHKVSLLGYGAMRLPTVDGGHANNWAGDASKQAIDQQALNRQVKYMLDHGVNYFDTAPAYCRGESEAAVGAALKASGYARDAFVIATKMSNFSPLQWNAADSKQMFETSLRRLQTDYVDNYLLHSIGNGGFDTFRKRYLDNGILDWLVEQRAKRRIRNLGFSFHGDVKTFEWCMANHAKYRWDFAMIQLNYVDWLHAKEVNARNVNAKWLYDELTSRKIPVAVMEPLLGGRLARYNWALANELVPLDAEATLAKWALRFCGSMPNVMTVLSGMTFQSHIEENVATFSPLKPCDGPELEALECAARALLNLNTVPCTACNYCMPCPYGLDIPVLLGFRNEFLASKARRSPQEILKAYGETIPEGMRRAEHCTGCGRCVPHCPQSINVPKEIASIDAWIDDLKSEAVK